jgi:hypothetical protein
MDTYQMRDFRTLDLHRRVVDKVRADPVLFEKAYAILKRWRETASPSNQPYLAEWQRLIELGLEECLRVATEETQYAAALRKSSPFSVLLTQEERLAFNAEWKDKMYGK